MKLIKLGAIARFVPKEPGRCNLTAGVQVFSLDRSMIEWRRCSDVELSVSFSSTYLCESSSSSDFFCTDVRFRLRKEETFDADTGFTR